MMAAAAPAARVPARRESGGQSGKLVAKFVLGRAVLVGLRLCIWLGAAGAVALATPSYAHIAVALRTARDVASYGFAAAEPGWLGAFVVALLVRFGGVDAIVLATAVVVLAMLFLVERRCARGNSDAFALAATLLAGLCTVDALAAGNGAVDWFFAALLLILLDRPTVRASFAATLLIFLWCNVSLAGLYGVALVVLSAVGTWCDDGDVKRYRRAFAAAAGAAVAALMAIAVQHVSVPVLFALIEDPSVSGSLPVLPAVVAPHGYRAGFTAAILSLSVFGMRPFRARAAILVVASIFFALRDGAAVPLAGIVVAPILARSLRELWNAHGLPKLGSCSNRDAPAIALSTVLIMSLLAALLAARPVAFAGIPSYVREIDGLALDGRPHRLFCAHPMWCSYAYGVKSERFSVLADDRTAASRNDVARDQSTIASVERSWRNRLASRKITDVLAVATSPLAALLRDEAEWRIARSDGGTLLFQHKMSAR